MSVIGTAIVVFPEYSVTPDDVAFAWDAGEYVAAPTTAAPALSVATMLLGVHAYVYAAQHATHVS